MPRPRKWKKVCCIPEQNIYGPIGHHDMINETIIMSVEEYETIRLIDHEGLSQEECAERMSVARTTVQKLYSDARKKLSDMLILSHTLRIEGGDFKVYDETDTMPRCCNGHHHGRGMGFGRGPQE